MRTGTEKEPSRRHLGNVVFNPLFSIKDVKNKPMCYSLS